jgi:hypothetical protein
MIGRPPEVFQVESNATFAITPVRKWDIPVLDSSSCPPRI